MNKKDLDLITDWTETYCEEHGLYLVRIETAGNKFTIYVDTMENVTIDQCTRLSRHIQHLLEEETSLLAEYTLDVSSPGMSNSLIHPFQFEKRIGKNLHILTEDGQDFTADIVDVDEEKIKIKIIIPKNKKTKEEEQIIEKTLDYNQIKKAFIPLPTTTKKK